MQKRTFLALGIGLAGIACLFLLIGHREEREIHNLKRAKEEVPLLEAQGITLTEWDEKGKKVWELQADSGTEFVERTLLNRVRVSFFEEEVPASEGKAEKVLADNQTSDFILQGKTNLISHLDGAELLTSNLKWVALERKLRTMERVLFKRGNLITEGRELIASPDLAQIVIKNDVTTRLIKTGG